MADTLEPSADIAAPDQTGEPAATPDVSGDSSPATEAQTQPDVTAESSTEGVGQPQSMLDAVNAALQQKAEDDPGSPAQEDGQTEKAPEKGTTSEKTDSKPADVDPAPDDGAEDEFEDANELEFGKHPRFRKLLRQWKSARSGAQQYRQIQDFLDQNGVAAEQAATGLKLMALLQHARRGSADHARLLLEDIEPLRKEIRELLGEDVADDLRERIDEGTIDEQTAREVTQIRRKLAIKDQNSKEDQAREQRRQAEETARATRVAVSDWESQIRTLDADYDRKASLVLRTARALAVQSPPGDPEAAVKLVQQAYETVNADLKNLLPTPTPSVQRGPRTSSVPPSQVRPEPQSLKEAVELGLRRTYS